MHRIVFLSRRGDVSGPLAQALFNRAIAECAPGTAVGAAAALQPALAIQATTQVVLDELGVDTQPMGILEAGAPMLRHADRVIALDRDLELPEHLRETAISERWDLVDPGAATIERVRALAEEIRARVGVLAREIVLDAGN